MRAVGARYAESTFRLESALRTAATLREATADDTVRLDRALSERQEALNHVLALLQQTAAETAQARALSSSSQPPSW